MLQLFAENWSFCRSGNGQTEAPEPHAAFQLLFEARGPFITVQNFAQ